MIKLAITGAGSLMYQVLYAVTQEWTKRDPHTQLTS